MPSPGSGWLAFAAARSSAFPKLRLPNSRRPPQHLASRCAPQHRYVRRQRRKNRGKNPGELNPKLQIRRDPAPSQSGSSRSSPTKLSRRHSISIRISQTSFFQKKASFRPAPPCLKLSSLNFFDGNQLHRSRQNLSQLSQNPLFPTRMVRPLLIRPLLIRNGPSPCQLCQPRRLRNRRRKTNFGPCRQKRARALVALRPNRMPNPLSCLLIRSWMSKN